MKPHWTVAARGRGRNSFIALGVIAIAIAVALGLVKSDARADAAVDKRPPHVRLLDQLRASDSVLPPVQQRIELYSVYNQEAPIPPQCYTRTEGKHNPCYVCHQGPKPDRENTMDDADLQAQYSFSDIGATNHWMNLFQDRSKRVASISDAAIRAWIEQDNYSELPGRLQVAGFQGWIPDLANLQRGAAAFDGQGFAIDGSQWVAINYKPFPSTFWPTNGSTDDVMIRLPEQFRQDAQGQASRDAYLANLAILENSIKGLAQVGSWNIDENKVAVDLDGDGSLGRASVVKQRDHYVGAAAAVAVEPTIYPQGTEFLHTVRYIGVAADGGITNATRMKEVRYMRRWIASSRERNRREYSLEAIEKAQGETPAYLNFGQEGLATRTGWQIAGFIEDRNGRLRANTFEENMFCMGCHNSIGSTVDKTFSFARKRDGAAGWGYINLRGMPDAPTRGESRGEIATYLERVGGGSEFRSNAEMQSRWYRRDGSLNAAAISRAKDVYELITPSMARALQLNKAYKLIVEDQSYLYGRDPVITPPQNVYRSVDPEKAPTLPEKHQYQWDIRLSWSNP
jgi:hypothetical protein